MNKLEDKLDMYESEMYETIETIEKELNKIKKNKFVAEAIKINEEIKVLAIPDLHIPFTKEGYLEFCKKMYKDYDCNMVVFLGDILDNHYSSYHETDPDGLSAKDELENAKRIIKEWYEAFPNAKICLGNHDRLIIRKAFSSGLSKAWIKSLNEVLQVKNWEFKEHFIIDNVLYTHGEARIAKTRTKQEFASCVQGHRHSQSYIEYSVGRTMKEPVFAMQLGAGIDDSQYAFAYAKDGSPTHINVGIIIDRNPLIRYMK